nr:NEDD4-binding protein 2 isoform X1 [Onthophagus taurus]
MSQPEFVSEDLDFLYRQFPTLSPEIINMVASQHQYNIQRTGFYLYEIAKQSTKEPESREEKSRIVNIIRDGWKIIVLMRGLPGSGKTHLANEIFRASNIKYPAEQFILSTDDYFKQGGGYNYDVKKLETAHDWNQQRCHKLMCKGFSPVIIDNTNLVAWEMKVYCLMAVEYGYIIEILEPNTDWACDPSILAKKNKHNVPKDKIIKMLNKYDQSITTLSLAREFQLRYKQSIPQKRLFPPLFMGSEENYANFDCNVTQRRGVTTKNLASSNSMDNFDFLFGKKPEDEEPIIEYVHRFDTKKEEVKGNNSKEEVKVDNNATILYPSIESLEQNKSSGEIKNIQNDPNTNQGELKPDESKTSGIESKKSYSSEPNATESKSVMNLIDLLDDNTSSAPNTALNLYGAFPLMPTNVSSINQIHLTQTTQNKSSDLKSSSSNEKNHLTAWGTNEKALQSWNTVVSVPSTKLPIEMDFEIYKKIDDASRPRIQHSDKTTNTHADDFRFALNCKEADGVSVINTKNRSINPSGIAIVQSVPRKRITVDIGCMTIEEEVATIPENNKTQVEQQLKDFFPHIPIEYMLEIYDKCKQDINWTMELLLETPYDPKLEVEKKKVIVQNELPTNNFNDAAKSSETVSKKDQLKQEKIELKKQFEENVTFKKEHYSDFLWGLKNQRQGTSQTSKTPPITPQISTDETQDVDDDFDEEVVQINLGRELVEQLEKQLGNEAFINKNLATNVQMPISLVKQIHALYLQSVCQQIEEQNLLVNKDEEYAHKLNHEQQEEANGPNLSVIMDEQLAMFCQKKENEQYKTMAPQTLAMIMKKKKLYESFPTVNNAMIDKLLESHNYNYDEVVDTLIANVNHKYIVSDGNVREDPISDALVRDMVQNKTIVEQIKSDEDYNNAQQYRDDAISYAQKAQHLQNVAQQYHRKGMGQVAVFYSKLAEDLRRKRDLCDQKATYFYLVENFKSKDTLDLHYLKVTEALISLDIYIDKCVSKLVKPTDYFIITGQGNRSVGGISKLRPAVIGTLKKRNIRFTFINDGMLKIKLHKNVVMTNDLKK